MATEEIMYYLWDCKNSPQNPYFALFLGDYPFLKSDFTEAKKYNRKDAEKFCKDYRFVAFPCNIVESLAIPNSNKVWIADLHKPTLKTS